MILKFSLLQHFGKLAEINDRDFCGIIKAINNATELQFGCKTTTTADWESPSSSKLDVLWLRRYQDFFDDIRWHAGIDALSETELTVGAEPIILGNAKLSKFLSSMDRDQIIGRNITAWPEVLTVHLDDVLEEDEKNSYDEAIDELALLLRAYKDRRSIEQYGCACGNRFCKDVTCVQRKDMFDNHISNLTNYAVKRRITELRLKIQEATMFSVQDPFHDNANFV